MIQTLADLQALNLHNGDDFKKAMDFIRYNGEVIALGKWWYDGYFMFMDPSEGGFTAMIVFDTIIYNGSWHYICKDGRNYNWDVEVYCTGNNADGSRVRAIDYKLAAQRPKPDEDNVTKWTSEDEHMLNIILMDINYAQKNFSDSKLTPYQKKIDWINSLKNRINS
jgi:hypothetical protein